VDCRYVHERLTMLMFNELSERELEIIQPHLSSCRNCIAEQDSFRKTFAVVQTVVRSGGWVPDQFSHIVTEKLAPRTGRRLKHDRLNAILARKVIRMAVIVLVGVMVVGLFVIYSDHLFPHWVAHLI
jgi:hypothetical protein